MINPIPASPIVVGDTVIAEMVLPGENLVGDLATANMLASLWDCIAIEPAEPTGRYWVIQVDSPKVAEGMNAVAFAPKPEGSQYDRIAGVFLWPSIGQVNVTFA